MPSRKALKLMRKDSVASFLTAQEIIERQNLTEEELTDLTFFVINGNCLDQVQDEIALVAGAFLENTEEEIAKRNISLQTIMPPLFALKVLTNGTQAMIAQELKIKGNSTTLGNTSHAFFDSLFTYDSFLNITSDSRALISCSTGAGLYTLFNHQKNYQSSSYHLCLCSASLFISREQKGSLGKITELDNKKNPPKLSGPIEISLFNWVEKQNRSAVLVYMGVPADEFNVRQIEVIKETGIWKKVIDLSGSYGYLGTSSINLGLVAALELMKNDDEVESVDIINIDPYGKESLIKVERS